MTATHEKNSGAMRSAHLMFWTTGVFWFSQYATTPFLNAELQRMGVSAAFMGLVAGLYGLSQMLLRLPLGMAADRMGRQKPFIVLGCGLLTVAGFGFLKWYTPHSFLWLRALMGVSSSAWVSFTVLYGSYYPATEAPRRISQLNVANQSGRLLCYTLGAWLVAGWGVRSAFWMGALSAALCFAMSLMVKEQPKPGQATTWGSMLEVARDPYMQRTSLLGILTQLVAFSTYISFTVNLAIRLGAQEAQLSLLNIALMVPTVLANILMSGWMLRRVPVRYILMIGFLCAALYCVLAPLAGSMMMLYLCQPLAGIASACTFGTLLGQCVRDIPPERRAAGMGLFQAVYGIGMTLGPVLMGVMIDWMGLNLSFFTIGAVALYSAWLSVRLMR